MYEKYAKYLRNTDNIVPGESYTMTELHTLLPSFVREKMGYDNHTEVVCTLFVMSKKVHIHIPKKATKKKLISVIRELGLVWESYIQNGNETRLIVFYPAS